MSSRRKEKDEDKQAKEIEGRLAKIEGFLGSIFGNNLEIENTQFLLAKLRVAEQRFLMGEQSRQIFLQYLKETDQETKFNDWFNKKREEEVAEMDKMKKAEAPAEPAPEEIPQGKTLDDIRKERLKALEEEKKSE